MEKQFTCIGGIADAAAMDLSKRKQTEPAAEPKPDLAKEKKIEQVEGKALTAIPKKSKPPP